MADPSIPARGSAPPPGETQEFDPRARQDYPLLGQVVEHYHLTGIIGQGGHGTVYRARDIRLNRDVALKLLRYPDDPTARAALLREARTIAGLGSHPNVVSIYAWGELHQNCFFALEYGQSTAAALLREHPEGLDEALLLTILRQCAEGLEHAHASGVLHLDIKPENILIDRNPLAVRLCDFGLARFYQREKLACGAVCGSPAFMSPEQIRGETLGPASDLFSLGATGYYLATGCLPFEGATVVETTERILTNAIQPADRRKPTLSPTVVRILHRCLDPEASRRFASARELANALRACEEPMRVPGVYRPLRNTSVLIAAMLAVVAGGLVLPLFTGDSSRGRHVVEADGRAALEAGDYPRAVETYEELLEADPDNDQFLYGLGYACLLARNFGAADAAFQRIGNPQLAEEGRAATAQARNEPAARPAIEAAETVQGTAYAGVLLALSEVAGGRYEAAREYLLDVDEKRLTFDWQRVRLWQTLGQVHFRLGDLVRAREAFERITQNPGTPMAEAATDYLAITQAQLAQSEYEQLRNQISRLKAFQDNVPDHSPVDEWTSRPLRLWIPPVTAQRSVLAVESGLVDVLPWKLSKALLAQRDLPLDVVDRNYTAALLQEQALSSQLSSDADAVRLGRLLGARLALFCAFNTVLGEESLNATLVDVETTRAIPLPEISLVGTERLSTWVDQVARAVVNAMREAYPLRGVVRGPANAAVINIGTEHGLKTGMRIRLGSSPDTADWATEATGTILEPVGGQSAPVQLVLPEGVTLPETGWFAEVIGAEPGDV